MSREKKYIKIRVGGGTSECELAGCAKEKLNERQSKVAKEKKVEKKLMMRWHRGESSLKGTASREKNKRGHVADKQ